MKLYVLTIVMVIGSAAFAYEHSTYTSIYETHHILAEDVKSLEITLTKEIDGDGCNSYSIYGNFNEVNVEDMYLYVPYLGQFGILQTEMNCFDDTERELIILSKTFSFEANDNGRVGLELILSEGYSLSIKEIEN